MPRYTFANGDTVDYADPSELATYVALDEARQARTAQLDEFMHTFRHGIFHDAGWTPIDDVTRDEGDPDYVPPELGGWQNTRVEVVELQMQLVCDQLVAVFGAMQLLIPTMWTALEAGGLQQPIVIVIDEEIDPSLFQLDMEVTVA